MNFETATVLTNEESQNDVYHQHIKIINDLAINSSEQERKILKEILFTKHLTQ